MGIYHGSSLLIATVDLPTYEPNPLDAYKWRSVRWQFASPYIVDLVMNAVRTQQQKFIDNVVTDVSNHKISIIKGLAGNMFENGVLHHCYSRQKLHGLINIYNNEDVRKLLKCTQLGNRLSVESSDRQTV
jgi:hypothetical protein